MRKDQLPSQSCNLVDRNARTSNPLGDLVAAIQGKKEPAIAGALVNILMVSVFTEDRVASDTTQ